MYKGEGEILRERMFSALLRKYERVTGFHETNPNAIYHHKLSLWPCLLQVRETFAHAKCESMRIVHAKTELKKEGRAKTRPCANRYSRRVERLLVGAGIAAVAFTA